MIHAIVVNWSEHVLRYEGKTLKSIHAQMQADLRVEGPRGLVAVTDTGAVIATSIYDGGDFIKNRRQVAAVTTNEGFWSQYQDALFDRGLE